MRDAKISKGIFPDTIPQITLVSMKCGTKGSSSLSYLASLPRGYGGSSESNVFTYLNISIELFKIFVLVIVNMNVWRFFV